MSLKTYLTYITKKLWQPHSKFESYGYYAKWTYGPNIFPYIYQNTTTCNSYFKKQIYPSNAIYMSHVQISLGGENMTTMSVYTLVTIYSKKKSVVIFPY